MTSLRSLTAASKLSAACKGFGLTSRSGRDFLRCGLDQHFPTWSHVCYISNKAAHMSRSRPGAPSSAAERMMMHLRNRLSTKSLGVMARRGMYIAAPRHTCHAAAPGVRRARLRNKEARASVATSCMQHGSIMHRSYQARCGVSR